MARTTLSGTCVFSIILMMPVVSFILDSYFIAVGCTSESTKLEIRSIASLLRADWSYECRLVFPGEF